MSFDKIFDLTAGVFFIFYNIYICIFRKYSANKVHAVFTIQTVNFALVSYVPLRRSHLSGGLFFLLIFRQVMFLKMWPILEQNVTVKKTKEKTRRSGLGMGNTCAKFQDLSLKNAVDIWPLVRKNE